MTEIYPQRLLTQQFPAAASSKRIRPLSIPPPPGLGFTSDKYALFVKNMIIAGALAGDWGSGRDMPDLPSFIFPVVDMGTSLEMRKEENVIGSPLLSSQVFERRVDSSACASASKRRVVPTQITSVFDRGESYFSSEEHVMSESKVVSMENKENTHDSQHIKKQQPPPPNSPERRLQQRQKQIDIGKNTPEYQNYLRLIPKEKRKKGDPQTPDKTQEISKRNWEGQVKAWRRRLHEYDDQDGLFRQ